METILIDEKNPSELHFEQGGEVVVFDQTSSSEHFDRKVVVSNNTKLRWYSIARGNNDYSLQFETKAGESIVRSLLLSSGNDQLKHTVHSILTDSNTLTNIHILSLVGENGIITLNGTVQIDSSISKVKGHILEENVFLGSKGSIRGIPSLLVHSDDVEAGHAARIERVSDEKLYYLRSRGIPRDDATMMMIQSAVANVFGGLEEQYQEGILHQVMNLF